MLNNGSVKSARTKARPYKLTDGRGLHLYVAPSGLKSFRWRCTWQGNEQLVTIGSYPEVTLDQARHEAELRRQALARGEDPRRSPANDAASKPTTFEPAARAWLEHNRADWSPQHAADVLAGFERDVFPAIGAMPLAEIRAPAILRVLRSIEARGHLITARRMRQRIECVFKLACCEEWCAHNPAVNVTEGLKKPPAPKRHPALTDVGELRQLLAAVDGLTGAPMAKLASTFLALTAVRLAAVRGARWGMIEDLDGPAPLWRVPAALMKLKADKKRDAANDQEVPLSAAAVAVLHAARANMHPGDADMHGAALIFPGRGGQAPIGENALLELYRRTPFAGRHVPHGWRASFSTVLNEAMPEERGVIDRALGHAGGGRDGAAHGINQAVEGAYNRASHLPSRRKLFEAWAMILGGNGSAAQLAA